jgi:SPP1 family predicted phage head-tail adaptor
MGVLSGGELDRRIGLYHQVKTPNSSNGEPIVTYSTPYAMPYAKRGDLKGTKRLIAQQTVSQQQIEYTIRYIEGVLSTDRVVNEDGLTLEIMQIAQLGRREGLCLLCRMVVP